jgi:hypothetical protein
VLCAGAKDVRLNASLRQGYAYAIIHDFVADSLVFTWVAITPFLVIITLLVLGTVFLPALAGCVHGTVGLVASS